MNAAIVEGARDGLGIGEALGARLDEIAEPRIRCRAACCSRAWRACAPGDGARRRRHGHAAHPSRRPTARPSARPRTATSACSARWSRELNEGGVYLNVGSAVVLPEVFLKAVSVVRNLGYPLADFTTVELRFPPALPAARERRASGRTHSAGGQRHRHHRASRTDGSAAGGGSLECEP